MIATNQPDSQIGQLHTTPPNSHTMSIRNTPIGTISIDQHKANNESTQKSSRHIDNELLVTHNTLHNGQLAKANNKSVQSINALAKIIAILGK